jgi:glucose/arabinose dehydrogenase
MLGPMGRWWLRAVATAGVLAAIGVGACLLLPERFAVNVPIRNALFGTPAAPPTPELVGARIRVPEGLSIGVFAELPRVRALRATPAGDLLASVPREGRIALLARDANGDGRADGVRTLLEGLNRPHGIDLHEGWLYVGETDAVGRVRFDAQTGTVSGSFERVVTGLPAGGNHWTRTLRFGPDGGLYVSVGSSCNVCLEQDPRRAALLRFRPDGSGAEIYARGLRNAVGFDWRPDTGELFATDNGRDLLGDDTPPCELNRVVKGGFYGWPFANGAREADPDLGAGHEAEIQTSIPPAHAFRAHNAPLGIAFLQRELAPGLPRGTAIVALHGSWNRTRKDGYKVVSLHFAADGAIEERDFVWGLLDQDEVIGRPVDVALGADGAVYVSDDYGGVVYRVAPGPGRGADPAGPAAMAPRGDPLAALAPAERPAAGARGAALYEANACFGCHEAERAEPGVVAKPLRDLTARYDLAGLVAFLAAPTPPMPAYPLEEGERRDLAAFLLGAGAAAARK